MDHFSPMEIDAVGLSDAEGTSRSCGDGSYISEIMMFFVSND